MDWLTKLEEDIKILLEVGWYSTQIPIPLKIYGQKIKLSLLQIIWP
jgi:hypothetical protein